MVARVRRTTRSARGLVALVCSWLIGALLFGVSLLGASPVGLIRVAAAQPIALDDLPPELGPWVPWVLDGVGDEACTAIGDQRVCAWPGRVAIRADAQGAGFELEVVTERRTAVALPGGRGLWPEEVRVGAADAVVLDVGGAPTVTLPAGRHIVTGRIAWSARPAQLPMPARIGLVELEIDGTSTGVRRDAGGLWLSDPLSAASSEGAAADPAAAAGPDRLEIEVFRKITDGAPLMVSTRMKLRVSGKPREVDLGQPTLGGRLVEVKSGALSVRGGDAGSLRVGLRAGEHIIELRELHHPPPAALARAARPAPWPATEIWVFAPNLSFRQVRLGGAAPIDPSRTNLPPDMRGMSTFQLGAGDALAMETLRRGQAEPPPARLRLDRQVWLDAAGDGYTVLDRFSGPSGPLRRLDFAGAGELGRVSRRGGEDELITLSPDGSRAGIEMRAGSADLEAEWRGGGRLRALPAVGWATDVDTLTTVLHLPPGWRLLGATGVDTFTPSPLADWSAMDVLVLVAAAALLARATRPVWGVAAALGLAVAHPDGGFAAWMIGVASGALLLARARPHARIGQIASNSARGATLVLGLVIALFAGDQGRLALFPELRVQEVHESWMEQRETETAASSSADSKEGGSGTRAKGEEGTMGRPAAPSNQRFAVAGPAEDAPERSRPAAATTELVQTGHGVPAWRFEEATLGWTGPVEAGRTLELMLLGPIESALLALGRCLLLGAAVVALARAAFARAPLDPPSSSPYRSAAATAAAAAVLAALAVHVPGDARAEAPSAELLADLRARLVRPAACAPQCLSVSTLTVRAAGRSLELEAEVHAGAPAVYALPGPAASWTPAVIEVDGKAAAAVVLEGAVLQLRVAPGRHRVSLRGPLAGDTLTLSTGTTPQKVRTEGRGWAIDGVSETGVAEGSLSLRRTAEAPIEGGPAKPGASADPQALLAAPWVTIERSLVVGVTWSVRTVVKAASATGAPATVRVPLWPGERVTDPRITVDDATALVPLDATGNAVSFDSAMAITPALDLTADAAPGTSTAWSVQCGSIWRCDAEGLAPIARVPTGTSVLTTYQPWPGETLALRFVRSTAAEGRTTTIDHAHLAVTTGDRVDEVSLDVAIRSSAGGVHTLTIPEGVRVTEVAVGGVTQPESSKGGALRVTLPPGGSRVLVAWQAPAGGGLRRAAPEVRVGDQVVNAIVTMRPAPHRTVVWTSGDGWGPRVLALLRVLVFAAAALGLSRLRGSPLPPRHAVPLAAGLALLPTAVAAVVALWFVVAARRRAPGAVPARTNAAHVGLAVFTGAALLALAGAASAQLRGADLDVAARAFRLADSTPMQSAAHLAWYVDHTDGTLPDAWMITVSPWWFRAVFGAWCILAGWLVVAAVRRAWASALEVGLWRRAMQAVPAPQGQAPQGRAPQGHAQQAAPATHHTAETVEPGPPPDEGRG